MKLKAEKTIRGVPHAHHADSRRSLWKADVWGGVARTHYIREQDDETATCDDSDPYPPALLEVLEIATKKCPSVSLDVDIMDGQPCIAGTRIPVRAVLRVIEQYGSLDEAVRCYPHLTKDQVKDALYFSQLVLELPSGIEPTTPAS
jgi:uncharacterized protein (DUF433 family)